MGYLGFVEYGTSINKRLKEILIESLLTLVILLEMTNYMSYVGFVMKGESAEDKTVGTVTIEITVKYAKVSYFCEENGRIVC